MVNLNKGVFYAIAAYAAWGLLPLYWKLFERLTAWEILAQRMIWSFCFVILLLILQKRWQSFINVLKDKRTVGIVCLSSICISVNWLIYIWSVNTGHVIETSLGYYMNPLFVVCLGVLFLKERLHPLQWFSLALAATGVVALTVHYGHFPWVALSLAMSFALYGFVKKKMNLDAITSLAWETTIVFPISVFYSVFLLLTERSTLGSLPPLNLCLLLLAGVATALPLLWFAQATRLLRLSTVGLFQYVSPTISLLLGVLVFHEAFTTVDLISFGCIWIALILYTWVSLKKPSHRIPIVSERISG